MTKRRKKPPTTATVPIVQKVSGRTLKVPEAAVAQWEKRGWQRATAAPKSAAAGVSKK